MSIDKIIKVEQPQSRGSLRALVGCVGEFTDGRDRITQCKITGLNYKRQLFFITYFNREAGRTIKNACLAVWEFRADNTPNGELCVGMNAARPVRKT